MTSDPPVHQLATSRLPGEHYAALRARGVHRQGDAWVIAGPADVAAALASPALGVAPAGPPAGAAAALLARMARFSDGADHARRRPLVEKVQPNVEGLEQAAAQRTAALVSAEAGRFDAMPVARTVPVAVLAAALGVGPADVAAVVTTAGRLCDGLAAASPDADLAAGQLLALLEPLGSGDDATVVAAASVLFQARDATAALIGLVLSGSAAGRPEGERSVEQALRHEPPVHCTRRVAVDDVELGGAVVPRGAAVWVLLAAAELGPPGPPATFGAGPHACPGSAPAVALARGVVAAIRAGGWHPVPGPVSYEPRPNLRLPARLLMERA